MPQNPLATAAQLDKYGLKWIWDFGFLRPQELGVLLWPGAKHASKAGERIARKWLKDGLVLRRELPNHSGSILVLAKAGAEHLSHAFGIDARSGKDVGSMTAGDWSPPKTWRHDLLAAGLLALMRRDGYTIMPEQLLRRENPNKLVPDGIAIRGDKAIWIEVESARKTGPHMDKMCRSLIAAARGVGVTVLSGITCNHAAIAYDPAQSDERGHALSHHQRVCAALEKHTPTDIALHFIKVKKTGAGVSGYEIALGLVEANAITQAAAAQMWTERAIDGGTERYTQWLPGLIEMSYTRRSEGWIASLILDDEDQTVKTLRFDTLKSLKRYAARLSLGLIKPYQ